MNKEQAPKNDFWLKKKKKKNRRKQNKKLINKQCREIWLQIK